MAIEVAMEDDLFFADLNRQISMLIDDDDDVHVCRYASLSRQEFPRMIVQPPTLLPCQYEMYQPNNNNARRETSKGTGVFIPQSSHPRRRYKQQQQHTKNNKNKPLPNSRRRSSYVESHPGFVPAYNTNINGC